MLMWKLGVYLKHRVRLELLAVSRGWRDCEELFRN